MNAQLLTTTLAAGGDTPIAGTIYQSIAAALVFLLLFFALKKMAWGPILKGLQDRENKVRGDLESAERAAKQAEQTLAEYRQRLSEAQGEATRIIEKTRQDAERMAASIKDQTSQEINNMRQRATAEIQAAKQEAIGDIYAQAATISTQIASRILRREINPGDQQSLVAQALSEINKNN